MPTPTEQETIQARILKNLQKIGWRFNFRVKTDIQVFKA